MQLARPTAPALRILHEPLRQQATVKAQFWVYVGDLRKDGWHVRNFDLTGEPKEGQVITAITDVFKRASKPVNVGDDNWRLGEIQGLISKGTTATIKSLYSIEGYGDGRLWWAEVST